MADIRTIAELVTQGAQKFVQDYLSAQHAVQELNTTLQQSERIRTPQLGPQIAAINSALASTKASGQQFVQTLTQIGAASQQVTQASNAKTRAIDEQGRAEGRAKTSGITYLSVLSAIHAASFLSSNRTFTLAGSFVTLGLAAGKVNPILGGLALVFGGFLAIFGSVTTAIGKINEAFIALAAGVGVIGTAVAAAVTAAGAAGVKIAADVQSQFALIAAVESATTEQLKGLEAEVTRLALTFGVSAQDVTAAASLFVRAGGDIAGAIGGATEAIIKLVVASAGELKAAEAARAVATGLRAFSQEGVTAEQIANAVAAAAQRSALSFTEVSQAFQQAVPGSVTLGITLSDLTAIITTLGNSALRGTVAGTSFKQFLLDLVNPSVKSAKALAELGVNILDSAKNIRPIFDIIADLNEALDTLSQGDRAQKIAEIFESRAGLAGAILSRTTITQLRELKAELDSLTVTNIVDVLLLPLNKQLERLGITVSELGRKFGGPLLDPIRTAVVTAINFFQQLLPLIELVGQSIAVVLTNQGFGALQQRISELVGNTQAAVFFQELVNTFRNVRDVIVNQIIPAIVEFGTKLGLVSSESGRLTDIVTTFQSINKTIQFLGTVAAVGIKALGDLAVQIIHNEGRGKELRDAIVSIGTAILTNLVTGLATGTAFLIIAAKIMTHVGSVIKNDVLPRLRDLANGFIALANVADTILQHISAPFTEIARLGSFAKEVLAGASVEQAAASAEQAAKGAIPFQIQLAQASLGAARAIANGIRSAADAGETGISDIDTVLREARQQADNTIKTFQDLGGAIPDALSNIRAQAAEFQRLFEEEPRTTGAVPGIDPEAVKRATDKVTELARDMSRKLANLAEDTATKTGNIVEKGLERLEDIFDKARDQLIDIGKDAQDQINDIFTNIGQRRLDRARTDALKDQLDKQLEDKQKELDNEARAEERALDRTRTNRQRDTEDNSRVLDEQFSDLERVLQRSQDASERAARRVQQVREDALKATQDAEERNLSRSLDAQATARREQQQLAEAKTPEERARVQAQIQASRTEAQFSRQQEDQLSALRKRHEAQQRALTEQNELQNIAFKQGQENQLLNFRKNNEKTLLIIRRNLEDQERGIREREEDTQLANRERRERQLQTLRRGHEQELRNLQDTLENEAAVRQANNIIKRASTRAQEIITNAVKQALEQQTAIEQQLTTQRQEIERSLRALNDQITDFEENLPADVKSAILGSINALRGALATGGGEITRTFDEERVRLLSQFNTTIGLGEIDLRSNIPNLTIPTPNVPIQVTPRQVIQASVIQAAQLIIGQAAAQQLGNTFLGALRQADQEGITLDTPVDFNPVIGAINVTNNSLNLLRGIFGR